MASFSIRFFAAEFISPPLDIEGRNKDETFFPCALYLEPCPLGLLLDDPVANETQFLDPGFDHISGFQ